MKGTMEEKHILIVEDNSDDIELIRRLFERNHLRNHLDAVSDGREALDYLSGKGRYKDRNPQSLPCLVLLDTRLPKLDGLEILKRLRSKSFISDLPVIMMTDTKDKEEIKAIKGYGLGVKAFLRKPFSFAGFVKAARKAGLSWMVSNEPVRQGMKKRKVT